MSSPVEEIKKRVDIVDLIGSYIRVSKAGANFKAVCPFHNEKTPSFYISPAREIWHCFGCNAGGDVFRFVSMIEGVEFPEALQMLASRVGVVLRREDPKISGERTRLFNLIEQANLYFQKELSQNNSVTEYLKDRGLKSETIANFNLGFAPDSWDSLLGYLTQKGFTTDEISKAGLIIQSSNPNSRAKYYDRFRSRIMFPIAEASGRVVGFSGRIFSAKGGSASGGNSTEAKYINSPNTLLYDKSKILYLWDRAKGDVRKENTCVIVEGQMDALMSHQAGITNTVATSGTALGSSHLFSIKRLASKLMLAFDNDSAGEAASKRAYELALDSGFEINVIEVGSGKDPADTIKSNPELWRDAIKNSKPVVSYFLNNLRKKFGEDLHGMRAEAKVAVLPYIARFPSEMEKAHWVQEVSHVIGLKEEPIWDELKKLSGPNKTRENNIPNIAKTVQGPKLRRHLVEERILGMLKWKNDLLDDSGTLKALFSKENALRLESILAKENVDNSEDGLSRLALEAELLYGESENLKEDFISLVSELERESIKTRLEILTEEIRKSELAGERDKSAIYLKEFQEVSRQLNNLWQKEKQKK